MKLKRIQSSFIFFQSVLCWLSLAIATAQPSKIFDTERIFEKILRHAFQTQYT